MSITIKVPEIHKAQLRNQEVKAELQEAQMIFEQTRFQFQEETIHFVFLKGRYRNLEKMMVILGVFVNKTPNAVIGIRGKLTLQFNKGDAQIKPTFFTFPQEFIGVLESDEGVLFQLRIPVKGLYSDAIFNFTDVTGGLAEVQYLKK